ncbi:MAG: hypothetical protein B7Y25_04595 [Alphaproteobacteria bacterium 16-39-46]|nr:MAG: hypothetical protein B7Y25_04595 [Alphaproteobacteria bacterium 16-39-46]OZA42471.1 MAG: hypothetical protein B7X84_05865 [Alphaproteobacteria bacterium 17-39-52]HQS84428.1 hypothetical protein [Alphaproteobacteria bacterium]HQS94384.1 hypothetical protein [Alphaproteobacteria bacterium]
MLFTQNSFPIFGHRISEILILEEIKDLISFGFKDITLFKKNKDLKIDFYFSNPLWEKLYIESNLYVTDPCVQGLMAINALILPWITLPQKELELRKKTCQVDTGLSILEKKDSNSSLMGHLGGEETFVSTLLSSKESLENLFLTFKKVAERL